MQILARDERGGGRDELQVARRDIEREVRDAARQDHRADEAVAARIGLGLRHLEKADAGRLQQHLDERGFGRGDERDGVELAFQQPDHRLLVGEQRALQLLPFDLVRRE